MVVPVTHWSELSDENKRKIFRRSEEDISSVQSQVQAILDDVRIRGDEAVVHYTSLFDKVPLNHRALRVTEAEFAAAEAVLSTEVKDALLFAIANVEKFHRAQKPEGMTWVEVLPGILAGERPLPIDSVGLYVPRGRGSFPSMVYMQAIPAQIAGVKRIVMVTPPLEDGSIDPACLFAARLSGVHEVYKVGGPQAIAALTFGTASILPVIKITGPGSMYVTAAKRLLSGLVDVGLPAGPSESAVLADGHAKPWKVALDMMVEAEHGSDSCALLVTTSEDLAKQTALYLGALAEGLLNHAGLFVKDVFSGYGAVIICQTIEEGAAIINDFAPEHLSIQTAEPFATLSLITNAAEILLGEDLPFSGANYACGPNAILPTGGKAKTWGPTSVRDFMKFNSVIFATGGGYDVLKGPVTTLADYEGFPVTPTRFEREAMRSSSTLNQTWDWLSSFTNLEKDLSALKRSWRLDRMFALLEERGHPEQAKISLHIAGSKGKGSTAAYLSSILTSSQLKTGLYSSPHVADWRERITLNGQFFAEEVYLESIGKLRAFWESIDPQKKTRWITEWGGEPSTFEWLTLAAFEIFKDQAVDARVLETGLGGRLDATNAQVPTASILTLIELEHTDILGDTLGLIANEKAGILKPQVPAWCAPQQAESLEVFRTVSKRLRAPLHYFDDEVEEFQTELSQDGTRLHLGLRDGTVFDAQLSQLGLAQGLNAAVAAWAVHGLVKEGRLSLDKDFYSTVQEGLEKTRLSGRMQILSRQPWVVLDGAHTVQSVKLLAESWRQLFGDGGTLVFGAFEGKAIEPMAAALAPHFQRVIVTPPGTFRPSNPNHLRQAFLDAGVHSVDISPSPIAALSWAKTFGQATLVCGSFYLVGEIVNGAESLNSPEQI